MTTLAILIIALVILWPTGTVQRGSGGNINPPPTYKRPSPPPSPPRKRQ